MAEIFIAENNLSEAKVWLDKILGYSVLICEHFTPWPSFRVKSSAIKQLLYTRRLSATFLRIQRKRKPTLIKI
jgi:hypothetical protein